MTVEELEIVVRKQADLIASLVQQSGLLLAAEKLTGIRLYKIESFIKDQEQKKKWDQQIKQEKEKEEEG